MMKVDKEQKRLKAIKLKYVFFPKQCDHCGEVFKKEKMWKVNRYGINDSIHKYFYCQNCMHSAKDVLNEIRTDESIFGIVGVDNVLADKKDFSRFNSAYHLNDK